VVCAVQGEALFLDDLPEPDRGEVLALLRERARDADLFVAPSRYYVGVMARYLGVPPERIAHVPLGLALRDFGDAEPAPEGRPFTIGYLARLCPEKGLHVLLEAFRELSRTSGAQGLRLKIAGYLGPKDRPWVERLRQQVLSWGLGDHVEWVGEVDRAGKVQFLRSLHVFSVPATYLEPKGLYLLESLAAGVPVVEPRHGAFPELLESTGGGVLCEPGSPSALAGALDALRRDPERRQALGRRGREAVRAGYNDAAMAESMERTYRRVVESSLASAANP
jgi:glycosyltransferase involved in cell wall biosynthesis